MFANCSTAACHDMDYLENDTYIECTQCLPHRSYVCGFSFFFFDEDGKGCIGLSIKRYIIVIHCNCIDQCNALIQDQISTSPCPRAVDAPRGRRNDIITYIINNITIKGNYS